MSGYNTDNCVLNGGSTFDYYIVTDSSNSITATGAVTTINDADALTTSDYCGYVLTITAAANIYLEFDTNTAYLGAASVFGLSFLSTSLF